MLVGTRVGLWLGVQLGLAGLLVLVGGAAAFGQALDEAAGWWLVYGALVDLGIAQELPRGVDPDDPRLSAAEHACHQYGSLPPSNGPQQGGGGK
jgi:hypothetical protein